MLNVVHKKSKNNKTWQKIHISESDYRKGSKKLTTKGLEV